MAKSYTLVFDLPLKDTLSSNRVEHFIVKGKKVANLRKEAIKQGIEFHAEGDDRDSVQKRVYALQDRQDWQTKKTALGKKYKKQGLTQKQIDEKLEEEIGDRASFEAVNKIIVPFLFDKAKVKVLIGAPTKRVFDPPNFWPTIKAITDGLTDCAWWEDDNFNYVTEVSFGYGEKSELKNHYRFTLIIESVD